MGGIDHDGGAEFAADGAWGRFGGVGGAEDFPDFADGVHAFIDEGDAFFGAGLVHLVCGAFAGGSAGHKADDIIELVVAEEGSEEFAELFFFGGGYGELEFLFDRGAGAGGDGVFEFGAEDIADGAIELDGGGGAHAVDLDGHDKETGAGEEVDHVARLAGGEPEVFGFDEDEGAFADLPWAVGDDAVEDAAVGIGVFGPDLEFGFDLLGGGSGEDGGFEVADVFVLVEDEVAVGIADGFAAAVVEAEGADDGADFADGVLALEEEEHDAAAEAGFGVGGELTLDVIADEFLDFTFLRVVGGDDIVGVFAGEFRAGGEHAGGDEVDAAAGDETGDDSSGAGFMEGVGGDDDVGEFLRHRRLVGGG